MSSARLQLRLHPSFSQYQFESRLVCTSTQLVETALQWHHPTVVQRLLPVGAKHVLLPQYKMQLEYSILPHLE